MKIILILLVAVAVVFGATAVFATKDFNSSKSNTSTSISQINEEVGNILLRYNLGGAEINKVTDALATGIAEEKLITLLTGVGLNAVNVKVVLAEFDTLGIASESADAGSVAPVPSAVSPAPIKEVVCTQEAKLCPDGSYVSRTGSNCEFAPCPSIIARPIPTPIPIPILPIKKCGVNTYRVSDECGVGAFKGAYFQCYDGYEEKLGGESSCKSSEVWQKYAREICANRCGGGVAGGGVDGAKPALPPEPSPKPSPTPCPLMPTVNSCSDGKEKVVAYSSLECGTYYTCKDLTPVKSVAICYIPDKLTKDYNQLLLDLRRAEEVGDPEADASRRNGAGKETAELIIKKITALKREIGNAREKCLANTAPSQKSLVHQELHRPPVAIAINRCQEVSQWENKIVYYQKLAVLSDAELKEQTGFSKEEIEKILAELPQGLVKVKAQCESQETAGASPTEAEKQIIVEPVKPVAVGSGQEIRDYYKAKIETIITEENTDIQIENLKSLKGEVDELIEKLIKGRKEMEVSEFDNMVSEIKVSRGEIKADDIFVKTTDKKVLFSPKEYTVSIAPTARGVEIIEIAVETVATEIKDGDDTELKITASEVSIKDNALLVGNSEVKLTASKVAENLGVLPHAAELKEENSRAVYKLKVAEPRKLFGFIPIRLTKTLTADAESSDLLDEKLPWYSFLTIR